MRKRLKIGAAAVRSCGRCGSVTTLRTCVSCKRFVHESLAVKRLTTLQTQLDRAKERIEEARLTDTESAAALGVYFGDLEAFTQWLAALGHQRPGLKELAAVLTEAAGALRVHATSARLQVVPSKHSGPTSKRRKR